MWRNPKIIALNQRVLGSSPSVSTIIFKGLGEKLPLRGNYLLASGIR